MRTQALVILLLLLTAVGIAGAETRNMALDADGVIYSLDFDGEQLVLSQRWPDGLAVLLPVPLTQDVEASSLTIAVDNATGSVIGLWEEAITPDLSRVMLVTHAGGEWFGPVSLAGDEGVNATSPTLLLKDAYSVLESEDGESFDFTTTILHLAWWTDAFADDGGHATYAYMRLDDLGIPDLDDLKPVPLYSRLPIGLSCSLEDHTRALAHPMLFVDPQTGHPHVIFSDIGECLFIIRQLRPVLERLPEDDLDIVTDQRRRHVVIIDRETNRGINPNLQLANAQFDVGHGMSIIIHWDEGDAVSYVGLDDTGWSDIKVLPLYDDLTHETAVELIRRTTH